MSQDDFTSESITAWAKAIGEGDRGALARAVTLAESTRLADQERAVVLSQALTLPEAPALRLGISGVPGAGKSTFIDSMGMRLIQSGHRVAVLAVDPSSQISGGSILGDKTRMVRLSREDAAFVRPSPSRGQLGGVAARTEDLIRLCEAAGFDIIFVETVGVGQSEAMVRSMVDVCVLLLLSGAGDSLQGIKRGVLEVADLILINKADAGREAAAEVATSEYRMALQLMRGADDAPQVLACSALEEQGLEEAWAAVRGHFEALVNEGRLVPQRIEQRVAWMWRRLDTLVGERLQQDPRFATTVAEVEAAVKSGALGPSQAALELVNVLMGGD